MNVLNCHRSKMFLLDLFAAVFNENKQLETTPIVTLRRDLTNTELNTGLIYTP